ncbi:MAG: GNAT family N-acetyltransferase [Pseudomonadota bacterium]
MTQGDTLTIRRADEGDAAALLPLANAFYAGPEYATTQEDLARHLRAMLADPRSAIILAEDGANGPVGFVAATLSTGLEFGVMAEIEDLYVRPGQRGKQIGSRLMVAVLDWCGKAGAHEVFLVIAQQGEPARQLERMYLRLGFAPSRRRLMYRALGASETERKGP